MVLKLEMASTPRLTSNGTVAARRKCKGQSPRSSPLPPLSESLILIMFECLRFVQLAAPSMLPLRLYLH